MIWDICVYETLKVGENTFIKSLIRIWQLYGHLNAAPQEHTHKSLESQSKLVKISFFPELALFSMYIANIILNVKNKGYLRKIRNQRKGGRWWWVCAYIF